MFHSERKKNFFKIMIIFLMESDLYIKWGGQEENKK